MDALRLNLVASGPIPLYRQLAEALRYRISSGALPPGTRLPPLREAGELWGVNLHTVRRAYLVLQEAGLVEVRRPTGTFVAARGETAAANSLASFAHEVLRMAHERFGVDAEEFMRVLGGQAGPRRQRPVHVVECSRTLSKSLARQVRDRWGGEVRAWRTDELTGIAPGIVVGTYFHFNEIRAALADRMADVRFVSIAPDENSLNVVLREARARGTPEIRLCEQDASVAPALAADVMALANQHRIGVGVVVSKEPERLLDGQGPVLFSPGSWDRLGDPARRSTDAFLLDYAISAEDLEGLLR